jgi:cytochrome P450
MNPSIPGTLLLDPDVLDNPYPFYDRLREEAPVWVVPGTKVVSSIRSNDLRGERVEDFSNNMSSCSTAATTGCRRRCRSVVARRHHRPGQRRSSDRDQRRAIFPDLVAKRMDALEPEVVDLASR